MNVLNDSLAYSARACSSRRSSRPIFVCGSRAAINGIDFDNTGLVNDAHDSNDYYANLRPFPSRELGFHAQHLDWSRKHDLGVNSNYVTLNYVATHRQLEYPLSHPPYDRTLL